MGIDIDKALRLKGLIDSALSQAPENSVTSAPALTSTYLDVRTACVALVRDTEALEEFETLFPLIDRPSESEARVGNPRAVAAKGDRARILLAGLAGWLGSWPSAEQLLDQLIAALEQAEATTDEPAEKARLAKVVEGLRGGARDIAVDVVAAYLSRVNL